MRGFAIGVAAVLAVLAATPAAAQDAGALQWLMGKWCTSSTQQGKVCLTFTPKPGGTITIEWASQSTDVATPEHSEAVMRIVHGRVTLESEDQGSAFREVSRGPDELVLQSTRGDLGRGSAKRVRYHRVGNDLVLEMVIVGEGTETVTYRRED